MKSLEQYLFEAKTTLQYHKDLNPKFWKNKKLIAVVRKRLLEIGKFWAEYANIPSKAIKDILLTGGNANYNYTQYSDLDVHILVDKKKIADCDVEIMDDYLKDKKQLWGLTHDIKIYETPVELYAQGLTEKSSPNQGVYSLIKDKWIKEPVREKVNFDDPLLQSKLRSWIKKIDHIISNKVDNISLIKQFKEKMRDMRSAGVRQGGEFSLENLVFKELRNQGYIDKLINYSLKVEDETFSLSKRSEKK